MACYHIGYTHVNIEICLLHLWLKVQNLYCCFCINYFTESLIFPLQIAAHIYSFAGILFPATQPSGQPHTQTGRHAMELSTMKFYSLSLPMLWYEIYLCVWWSLQHVMLVVWGCSVEHLSMGSIQNININILKTDCINSMSIVKYKLQTNSFSLIFYSNKHGFITTALQLKVWNLKTKEEQEQVLHTLNKEFLG